MTEKPRSTIVRSMRLHPGFCLILGLFTLGSCAAPKVFFADPETRLAAPGLIRAWNGSPFSGRQTQNVDQPVFDAEKYLTARSEPPRVLVAGSWADRGILQKWHQERPQTQICVIIPKETLPAGVTALVPDRRTGWKVLAEYAARHKFVTDDHPAAVIFSPRTPPELQDALKNAWNLVKPGVPLIVAVSDLKGGIGLEAVKKQLPPQPGFLFLLADRDSPTLLSEIGQKVPNAVEFPPEDLSAYWTVALVLDEDETEKVFSDPTFPGNKKEVLLPLRIRESVR